MALVFSYFQLIFDGFALLLQSLIFFTQLLKLLRRPLILSLIISLTHGAFRQIFIRNLFQFFDLLNALHVQQLDFKLELLLSLSLLLQ